MELSDKTARQIFEAYKANPTRKRFGFGKVPALINIDLQKAYTAVGEFTTAYETNPLQLEYVNALAAAFRSKGFPVVWTYVAYMDSGEDCGIWGTRTNTPDSLQNIKVGRPLYFAVNPVCSFAFPRYHSLLRNPYRQHTSRRPEIPLNEMPQLRHFVQRDFRSSGRMLPIWIPEKTVVSGERERTHRIHCKI